MKKISLAAKILIAACVVAIAVATFLLLRNNTPQKRAEKIAKTFLEQKILNDPGSYHPVSFSKLDTLKAHGVIVIGYSMDHYYRDKNSRGVLCLYVARFYFNKDLNKVLRHVIEQPYY